MKARKDKNIDDVIVFTPEVFEDNRGYFFESFNYKKIRDILKNDFNFIQDNQSLSKFGTVRGIHYQVDKPQAKLVSVVKGEIFDVAVDLRSKSKTFGQWAACKLSDSNLKQLWIPEGFGHGFKVLSEVAVVQYKTTEYYYPENERCILWNDINLNINWPETTSLLVSDKDQAGKDFVEAEVF